MTTTVSGNAEVGPPPPVDPQCRAALAELLAKRPVVALTPELIPALREEEAAEAISDDDLRRDGAFSVEERSVPGPSGEPDVSLLICRPTRATGPVPGIYYIHGGGLISGTNRDEMTEVLAWAEQLQLAVVSVEYRLAPETPHPGPVQDCYAGLSWTAQHGAELGIDVERLLIAGISAGGGLAAAVTLLARDRLGPRLIGQMLLCPMLDDRNDTVSAHQMIGVDSWDRTVNEMAWTALLGDARGGPDVSQYAAPARAEDLSNLPPTYLDVGSAETFRDEDVAYATRIWQSGGVAELHVWPGGYHGYWLFAPDARISQQTRHPRVQWLRRLLGG